MQVYMKDPMNPSPCEQIAGDTNTAFEAVKAIETLMQDKCSLYDWNFCKSLVGIKWGTVRLSKAS